MSDDLLSIVDTITFNPEFNQTSIKMAQATHMYAQGNITLKELGKFFSKTSNHIRQWIYIFSRRIRHAASKSNVSPDICDKIYLYHLYDIKNEFWLRVSERYLSFVTEKMKSQIRPKITVAIPFEEIKLIEYEYNIGQCVYVIDWDLSLPVVTEGYVLAIGVSSVFKLEDIIYFVDRSIKQKEEYKHYRKEDIFTSKDEALKSLGNKIIEYGRKLISQTKVFERKPVKTINQFSSEEEKLDILFQSIDSLNILSRTRNILRAEGIYLIGDLVCKHGLHIKVVKGTPVFDFCFELRKSPNYGNKSHEDLIAALKEIGFDSYYECPKYWEKRNKPYEQNRL